MSIQLKSKISQTQTYHTYYDLEIINNDTTGQNPPQILRFTEIRNSPYLMSPENYFLTVCRFQVQTPSLPVFIPQVQLGQADRNLLIYSFTLTYKNYEYLQYVQYTPTDFSASLPTPPLVFQDIESQYYFMYSYQQVISIFNTALLNAFNGLNTLVVAGGDTLPTANAPFFEFDPQLLLCILNADELGYSNTLTNPINIFCNAPCFTLFSTFQALNYGYTNIINGKNFQLIVKNINGTNILTLPTYNALQMYQEGSTCALWCPIQSLVFTTALLPVNPELVSIPKVFNADSKLFNTGNNSNLQPVLTDFVVEFNPNNTYKPNVVYAPNGEYRLIDLYGTSPLSAIELSVFWKDNFGGLHPFYLNSGCSANIKLLFRRKDYNNVNLNI
jgi:hypothetical protein